MTTTERLRALLDAATPGPWESDGKAHRTGRESTRWECLIRRPTTAAETVAAVYGWEWRGENGDRAVADAALVVAAVNALPRLLAVVEAAAAYRKACRLSIGEAVYIDASVQALWAALAALEAPDDHA